MQICIPNRRKAFQSGGVVGPGYSGSTDFDTGLQHFWKFSGGSGSDTAAYGGVNMDETSGALDIAEVDSRVTIVMDLKTPASGEVERNRFDNLAMLKAEDQVKFVIADRQDYEWSIDLVSKHALTDRVAVLFSPAWGRGIDRDLAEWILEDQLGVRMQIQLHKVLWGETPGH